MPAPGKLPRVQRRTKRRSSLRDTAVQRKGAGESVAVREAAADGIRSGGGALPHAGRIQQAFGRHDISHVQAHQGAEASAAARSMGAEAYAAGEHVAFAGAPSLHTAAHEAAHVVQQRAGVSLKDNVGRVGDRYEVEADRVADRVVRGESVEGLLDQMAPSGSAPAGAPVQRKSASAQSLQVQRRLSFNNTNWANARYLDASPGGAGGVLFAGETGKEVVVKPGEDLAEEGALAAHLHNEVAQTSTPNVRGVLRMPGFRVVPNKERAAMKAALTPLANGITERGGDKVEFRQQRAHELLANLDQPGLVVQDLAQGRGLDKETEGVAKHTKKGAFGKRKLRKGSPLRIFKDRRAISGLGSATAVDIFHGNNDRLFMWNSENIMVSPYAISMIDNIVGATASFFKTRTVGGQYEITGDEGLQAWTGNHWTKALAEGDFETITARIWDNILDSAARETRDVDKNAYRGIMANYKGRFDKYFKSGLAHGKEQLISSIRRLLNDRRKLQRILPGPDAEEIADMMWRRLEFVRTGAAPTGPLPPPRRRRRRR